MNRLDDIPKEELFRVPDGYFDDLPMRIQAKIQQPESKIQWSFGNRFALRVALPVLAVVAVVSISIWNALPEQVDVFTKLDTVPSEQLLAYLESEEITTEEIIENASFTHSAIQSLDKSHEEISVEQLNELSKQYDFNF